MATISNTPRPGYVWDSTDNVWYPIGVGAHQHTNAADTPAVMPYSTYAAAGKNKIINGDFNINQRGLTSNSGGYGFDRWQFASSGATGTYSAQTFTPGAAPVAGYEATNFARLAVTTGADFCRLDQSIENVRTFAGQTVTLSFWAKGTNPSTVGNLSVALVQYFGTGGSPSATIRNIMGTFVLTANWTRYTFTLSVPSISGKTIGTNGDSSLQVAFSQEASTSTDAWTLDVWGVQLEAGSTATAFQTATGNPASELAACQRYYYRQNSAVASARLGLGHCRSTTEAIIQTVFPVPMRTAPTALEQTGTASNYLLQDASGSGVNCNTVPAFNDASVWSAFTSMTRASGLVAGNVTTATVSAANIYLGWSVEL